MLSIYEDVKRYDTTQFLGVHWRIFWNLITQQVLSLENLEAIFVG